MPDKQQPVGTCDLCLGPIPEDMWHTRFGPRLYCSIECRNTGNSRIGNPIRVEKLKQSIADGRWPNPAKINPPDPRNIGEGVSKHRREEVAKGRWRNPALTDEARAKLSKPRRHEGILHRAIERLKQGEKLADLTPEERAAYREYRRNLYAQRKAAMTPEEIEQQRARWRANYHRYKKKKED